MAGHEGAFGFGAKSYKHLIKFKKHLEEETTKVWQEYVAKNGEPKSPEDFVISTLGDGDVPFDLESIYAFMSDIKYIEPFGSGWAQPLVKMRIKASEVDIHSVGADGSHARLVASDYDGFVIMAWSSYDKLEDIDDDAIIEVTGNFSWNFFNDKWSVNLICNELEVKMDEV